MKQEAYIKTGMLNPLQVKRDDLAKALKEAREKGHVIKGKCLDARWYQSKESYPYTYLVSIK